MNSSALLSILILAYTSYSLFAAFNHIFTEFGKVYIALFKINLAFSGVSNLDNSIHKSS